MISLLINQILSCAQYFRFWTPGFSNNSKDSSVSFVYYKDKSSLVLLFIIFNLSDEFIFNNS